jgi:hypothetical protein
MPYSNLGQDGQPKPYREMQIAPEIAQTVCGPRIQILALDSTNPDSTAPVCLLRVTWLKDKGPYVLNPGSQVHAPEASKRIQTNS